MAISEDINVSSYLSKFDNSTADNISVDICSNMSTNTTMSSNINITTCLPFSRQQLSTLCSSNVYTHDTPIWLPSSSNVPCVSLSPEPRATETTNTVETTQLPQNCFEPAVYTVGTLVITVLFGTNVIVCCILCIKRNQRKKVSSTHQVVLKRSTHLQDNPSTAHNQSDEENQVGYLEDSSELQPPLHNTLASENPYILSDDENEPTTPSYQRAEAVYSVISKELMSPEDGGVTGKGAAPYDVPVSQKNSGTCLPSVKY